MQDRIEKRDYTRQLLRLMAPLIAGNILQQLYNTIDVAVIARYSGQTDFAAVGVAGSVMNLFLFIVAGACSGLAIVLAQLYGADQWQRFRQAHFLSLTFGLALTALLTLAGLLSLRSIYSC